MGLEKVEVTHAHTPALSLSCSQLGEQKLGEHNRAEKRKELGGSETRRHQLKQVGFARKGLGVAIKWSQVKRERKTET